MSLTASTEIARSSLSTLQERASVISRNVANANNAFASRKIGNTVASPNGSGVRLASVSRAADAALFQNVLAANAAVGGQQAIVSALDQLNLTTGDPEADSSPAALVGKLAETLQQYSSAPQDSIRARAVLDSANDLANALNAATDRVQDVRQRADADIGRSVGNLNTLLRQVEDVNREIVKGTQIGNDVTDQLDTRDRLLTEVASEIGIRVVSRADNDIAIYTDSGVTLFDNTARRVSFEATPVYSSTTTGNPLVVDGVAVTGPTASMPIGSGRLKGLTDARDTYAVTYQSQLDEIARGLIEAFAESDQSGSGLSDATGVFGYSGSPAVPASATTVTGLAGDIAVSAAVDPNQGGDLNLLRDGGINGASYGYNSSGAAGFSGRIRALTDGVFAARSFDPTAEAGNQDSIADYAATSVGWLQEQRRSVNGDLEFNATLQERAVEALTQIMGVNLDFEMTLLLEIERSYQATSRLITTIDNMYDAIIAAA
jgi:flagellar hook-associated protein 1 FlgK